MPDQPRRKRTRGHKDARARILDAAADLFARHGYHATSMRQLARRAGVVPAAIYNHYHSKERLFLAVFLERAPHRGLATALEAAQGDTAEGLLRDGLDRMRQVMSDKTETLRLVFVEMLEFDGKHAPDLAELFLPRILGFVRRLQAAPGWTRPLPPVLVMRAIVGLFMSFVITQGLLSRIPGLQDEPTALDRLADILLYGMLGGPASSSGEA